MALILSEGFDAYSATADLDRRWLIRFGFFSFESSTGRFGGGHAFMTGHSNRPMSHFFITGGVNLNTTALHGMFWFKTDTGMPSSDRDIFAFDRSTDGQTWRLKISPTGEVKATRTNSSTASWTSASSGLITGDTWHHIEFKIQSDDSAGIVKVWVDGTIAIDQTGVDTRNAGSLDGWDECVLWGMPTGASAGFRWDDVVIWDETGTDFAETENLGEHKIETLYPAVDDSVQFTPTGTGTDNSDRVDESGYHDDDTTYVQSSTVGHVDRYFLEGAPTIAQSTYAIAVHSRSKKPEPGVVVLRNIIYTDSMLAEGTDRYLNDNYAHHADYWGQNPITASAWGNKDVSTISVGIKYQSE